MSKIALIGYGAIAQYVARGLQSDGTPVAAFVLRPARVDRWAGPGLAVASVAALPADIDVLVDCAGHQGLAEHGPAALARGRTVVTVSAGALADPALAAQLEQAAGAGGGKLIVASGAIGALDALRAAAAGGLTRVVYTGRKPPKGWIGSPAEEIVDLRAMGAEPVTHFEGTAREAALRYPKNANVAAAVALAGLGFERTEVALIADPTAPGNIHEITAEGAFGRLRFEIEGKTLPDNPRSSALAAMSALAELRRLQQSITT